MRQDGTTKYKEILKAEMSVEREDSKANGLMQQATTSQIQKNVGGRDVC